MDKALEKLKKRLWQQNIIFLILVGVDLLFCIRLGWAISVNNDYDTATMIGATLIAYTFPIILLIFLLFCLRNFITCMTHLKNEDYGYDLDCVTDVSLVHRTYKSKEIIAHTRGCKQDIIMIEFNQLNYEQIRENDTIYIFYLGKYIYGIWEEEKI